MKSNKRVLPNKRALFLLNAPRLVVWRHGTNLPCTRTLCTARARRPNPPSRRRSLAACDWIARP